MKKPSPLADKWQNWNQTSSLLMFTQCFYWCLVIKMYQCIMLLVWCFILRVNLTGPWKNQIFPQTLCWCFCESVCWMRLAFNLVGWIEQSLCVCVYVHTRVCIHICVCNRCILLVLFLLWRTLANTVSLSELAQVPLKFHLGFYKA